MLTGDDGNRVDATIFEVPLIFCTMLVSSSSLSITITSVIFSVEVYVGLEIDVWLFVEMNVWFGFGLGLDRKSFV